MKLWISPSRIAYLYEVCPRCVWMNHKGVKSLSGDFENFNLMDKKQKEAFPRGTRLDGVGIPGAVAFTAAKVCSLDYGRPGLEARIYGEYDFVALLDAGGYAVVDLKSGRPNPEKRERYRKQLSAYALALREPDRHQPVDVQAAYLLFCWPTVSTFIPEVDPPALMMDWRFAADEVELDIPGVRNAVAGIVDICLSPTLPPVGDGCPSCGYVMNYIRMAREQRERDASAKGGL